MVDGIRSLLPRMLSCRFSSRSRSEAVTRRWVERLERFAACEHTVAAFYSAKGVSTTNFYRRGRSRLTRSVAPRRKEALCSRFTVRF